MLFWLECIYEQEMHMQSSWCTGVINDSATCSYEQVEPEYNLKIGLQDIEKICDTRFCC